MARTRLRSCVIGSTYESPRKDRNMRTRARVCVCETVFTDGTESRSGGQSLHILIAPVKSLITLTQDQEAPFSHHQA